MNTRQIVGTRVPLATYRLQFNNHFTFQGATAIVPYLHRLGISDAYASSYLCAVPGSLHGYDVADPTRLNPDIGDKESYTGWVEALRACGMGQVLDLVPNHMGIARSSNPWWLDVLENGRSSRFARVFDISWNPAKDELAEKVLIPILGDQYGAVLERGELRLNYQDGAFEVQYYDDVVPIAPDTYPSILSRGLDEWLGAHADAPEASELQSIMTAADNLPPRTTSDAEGIATRAREKEVIKRRLASLVSASAAAAEHVGAAVSAFNGVRGQPRSFDALDALLNQQSYRLAHWRVASEEINYRRFFDINQLAAVRMEDPAVFEEVHRFVFELVAEGAVAGLRVDHVDGLYAPKDYLKRLQARTRDVLAARGTSPEPTCHAMYIVVEKILGHDERLPDWPVHGTTGYEFAATVNGLFVDRRNEGALDAIYARFRRPRVSFDDLAYQSRKRVMHETMSGDINSLGHQLNRFSERNRHFRDFTLYSLISTLKEVIACFPVYRTYVTGDDPVTPHDRRYIDAAITCAKRRAGGITSLVFDFIGRLLLKETPVESDAEAADRAEFIGKFQQITSPVAAKGIEDTALYVYNRLLSLNDVGSDPMRFGSEPCEVHRWMADRQRSWPHALSATATHDTKRGEDVRARINVLSELPGAWKAAVARWRALNRRFKTEYAREIVPTANDEYFLYQTLVGAYPFPAARADGGDPATFTRRIVDYMRKALREAKVHTSWLSPDEEYERAVFRFVEAILDRRRAAPFLDDFEPFQARIAELGIYNGLAQLLVKITAPGVPDFYQGCELWDLTLVDPDNRRTVDYRLRERLLTEICVSRRERGDAATAAELLASRADGRVKLFTMSQALQCRATFGDVYRFGEYVALTASGSRRDCVFAFARKLGNLMVITCVPRLVASLVPDGALPLGGVWGDTNVLLPDGAPDGWRDAITGADIGAEGNQLSLAQLFERFPIALVVPA